MKTNSALLSSPLAVSILTAYADCHCAEHDYNDAIAQRNLNFRAADPVTRDEAVAIMREALAHGSYNEFKPSLLELLPTDAQVTIAREGSVCVYVKGNPLNIAPEDAERYGHNADANPQFKADEISYDATTDQTRLWFD